eukprot:gb/GECG01014087.1/.p1 GENE.gb/GECG01014087.1/~~gb/GECG01014087.1/.p1  ORF type:complete len:542 (+),score=58.91 gb/GECG01014087.1/:1-1626(+)
MSGGRFDKDEALREAERVSTLTMEDCSTEPQYRVAEIVRRLVTGGDTWVRVLRGKGLFKLKNGWRLALRASQWEYFGQALAGAIALSERLLSIEIEGSFSGDETAVVQGARQIANALRWSESLISVRMVSCDVPASASAVMLRGIRDSQVRCVKIDSWRRFYEGNEHVEEAFYELLSVKESKLKDLTLTCNSGDVLGVRAAKALARGLQNNNSLKRLDIQGQKIKDEGAEAIFNALASSNIEILEIAFNSIGVSGAASLSEALKQNPVLQRLSLVANCIGDQGVNAFARSLQANDSLQMVDLSSNSITNEGASALAETLRSNSTLVVLRLNGNDVGDVGAAALGDTLRAHTGIMYLEVTACGIGASGIMSLAAAVGAQFVLRYLDISGNHFGVRASRRMRQAVQSREHVNYPPCTVTYETRDASGCVSWLLGFIGCFGALCCCHMCWTESVSLKSANTADLTRSTSSSGEETIQVSCFGYCLEPLSTCRQAFACPCQDRESTSLPPSLTANNASDLRSFPPELIHVFTGVMDDMDMDDGAF